MADEKKLIEDGENLMKKLKSKGEPVQVLVTNLNLLTELSVIINTVDGLSEINTKQKYLAGLDKLGFTDLMFQSLVYVTTQGLKLAKSNPNLNYDGVKDVFLSGLCNWANASREVCMTLVDNKRAIPFYIAEIRKIKTNTDREQTTIQPIEEVNSENSDEEYDSDDDNNDFELFDFELDEGDDHSYTLLLGFVLNMVKHPESRQQFNKENTAEVLKRLLNYRDETVQILAMCSMAILLSDTAHSAKLADKSGLIPKLVACLKFALENNGEHNYNGFSAEELAQALGHLAVNDENKESIAKSGAIDLFMKMLEGSDETEQERAIDSLWALSFNDDLRSQIKQQNKLEKRLLEVASNSQNEELKKKAEMANKYIKLGEKGVANQRAKSAKKAVNDGSLTEFDVFISYSHANQEIVLRIRDFLVKNGYKVWMDVDNMADDLVDSMASGIDQAKVVLLCFSEHYLQSNMCRTECKYMFYLGKPFVPINMEYRYKPTGWLGLILSGNSLYVDFSLHKYKFEQKTGDLLKQLRLKMKDDDVENDESRRNTHEAPNAIVTQQSKRPVSRDVTSTGKEGPGYYLCPCCNTEMLLIPFGNVSHPLNSQRELGKHVEGWSKADVNKWVTSIGFSASTLANFDGKALVSIFNIRQAVSLMNFYYTGVILTLFIRLLTPFTRAY